MQDDRRTHYLYLGEQSLGQQCENQEDETLLLLTDPNNSVLGECQQDTLRTAVYSAYGNRHSDEPLLTTLGFNGEVRDASSGWYLLGRGYRAYNPVLMRFHSPDSLSPFAAGGVNPYTYCLGNPIALRDPTGHDASVQSGRLRRPDEGELYPGSAGGGGVMGWVGVAVGAFFTVVGVASLAMTAGLAAPVSIPLIGLGVAETTSATVALVATTALTAASTAAGAVNATNGDQTAGSIALWTGVAAFGVGLGTGAASSAMRALSKPVNDKGVKNLILAGMSRAPSPAGSPGLAARASSRIPQPGSPAGSLSAAPVAVTAPGVSSTRAITRPAMDPAILAGAKAKLRPAAPTQAATAGGLDELKLATQARLEGKTASQALEAAAAADGPSATMLNAIARHAATRVIRS